MLKVRLSQLWLAAPVEMNPGLPEILERTSKSQNRAELKVIKIKVLVVYTSRKTANILLFKNVPVLSTLVQLNYESNSWNEQ